MTNLSNKADGTGKSTVHPEVIIMPGKNSWKHSFGVYQPQARYREIMLNSDLNGLVNNVYQ